MIIQQLWKLPVNSGHFDEFFFLDNGLNSYLLFEYSNESTQHMPFYGFLSFKDVMAYRNSTEMFSQIVSGSFDTVVEITDSEWVKGLKGMHPDRADFWEMRHYAIFLKDQGLFEFAARGFQFSTPKPGKLEQESLWTLIA